MRGISIKTSEQNLRLGNMCVIDVFVSLAANGHAMAEAALTFMPCTDATVRAAQPDALNRPVLGPQLISEHAAKTFGVDLAELTAKTTFRGLEYPQVSDEDSHDDSTHNPDSGLE